MLVEERLHLLFVNVAHLLWADSNFVPVLVVAGRSNGFNIGNFWYAIVEDTKLF